MRGAWASLDLVMTYLQEGNWQEARKEFSNIAETPLVATWAGKTLRCLFEAVATGEKAEKISRLREVFMDMQLFFANAALDHLPEYRLMFWRILDKL